MIYRKLGNSGVDVSLVTFSVSNMKLDKEKENQIIIKVCLDIGINHFETSPYFSGGESDECFGKVLENLEIKRESIIVSSKIYWGLDFSNKKMKISGCSKKIINHKVKESLSKTKLKYFDLLVCHEYDPDTPILEIIQTMNELIHQGLILYWGVSDWPSCKIVEAILVSKYTGAYGPIVGGDMYNLFFRERLEKDLVSLIDDFNWKSIVWSPLAHGLLNGEHNEGLEPSNELFKDSHFQSLILSRTYKLDHLNQPEWAIKFNQIQKIADELNCSMTQLAIAWVLKFEGVSSCTISGTSPSQIITKSSSIELIPQITQKIEQKLNKILKNKPILRIDSRVWKEFPGKR